MSVPGPAGRRRYDREIDPAVEIFVEERIGHTRHLLRDEFTAAMLSLSNKLDGLRDQVSGLQSADRADDAVDAALQAFKQGLDRRLYGMAGLIVAAAGVLVAVLK